MQMMAEEKMMMMMIMNVMCVCHNDDGAQKTRVGSEKVRNNNQPGDNVHIYAHYACMKTEMLCISAPDWRTCRTGEKQQDIEGVVAVIVDSFQ